MKWISLPNGMIVAGLNRPNTVALYEEIFVHDIYGRTGVEVGPRAVIFDIGANIGLFSLWARKRSPDCLLFCLEPSPPTYDALRLNIPAIPGPAIRLLAAANDKAGAVEFTHYPRLPELSTLFPELHKDAEAAEWTNYLRRRVDTHMLARWLPACVRRGLAELVRRYLFKKQTLTISATTIADLFRIYGRHFKQVDLVKIDVEKSELRVLHGIGDAWDHIRQIIVECYDGPVECTEVERILRAHDFNVSRFDNTMFPELRTPLIVGRRAA